MVGSESLTIKSMEGGGGRGGKDGRVGFIFILFIYVFVE